MPDESNAYRWAVAVTPPTDVPLFGELAPIQPSPLTLTTHHSPLNLHPCPHPCPCPHSCPCPHPCPRPRSHSLTFASHSLLLTPHSSPPQPSPTAPGELAAFAAKFNAPAAIQMELLFSPSFPMEPQHSHTALLGSARARLLRLLRAPAPPQGACASSGRAWRLWVTPHPHGGHTSPLVA